VSVVANVAINVDSSGAVSKLRQVQQGAQATSQAVDKLNATNDALAASFTKSGKPIQTAANGMRFFTDATGRARKENGQFVTTAEAAAAGIQKQGRAAQQAGSSVSSLGGTIRNLIGAYAAIQAVKFVFTQAAELESQSRSLAILAGSAEKAGQIIKELQQLGAVTPFTSTELIDSAKRLQAFGVEADKVVETTKRLADVSGATGAELSGLVTAYGQVQAKGRLQGEELLQFQERGVALQTELRKMYGLSGEEFQKALEKGRIGSEAVEVAILRLTSAGGKYANGAVAQSDTLNGKLSTLQDSFEQLARNIGKFFEPVFKFLIDGINAFLDRVNNGLRVSAQLKANEQAAIQTRQKFGGFRAANPFDQEAQRFEANLRQSLLKSALGTGRGAAPTAPTPAPATPGLLNAATAGGGARGGAGAAANDAKRAADEAKRAAEQMQQQLKAADDINFALKNRLAIAQTTEPVAKRMLEYDIKQNEIAKEYDELKKAAKGADELAFINANFTLEKKIAELEAEREINELLIQRAILVADLVRASSMPTVYNELEEQDAALQAILDKYPAIGSAADAAATLATSGIAAMIDGTKSAEQVFVEFLSSIADALIDTAKQMIAQYIAIGIARMFAGVGAPGGFAPSGPLAAVGNVNTDVSGFFSPSANGNAFGANGIIPFAKGGIVNSPTLFPFAKGIGLMGEAGPEAIMPLTRGPGGKLGVMASGGGGDVNVVVNVDAKGSSVEGNEQGANQLGRVISAAVQSELIKQQRPGGLLAR
jgi:tape measure domain-containing protein